ncbi:phage/plasmid replication protein, II/X family [Pseudomonas aeruginosa]|nr:phage/plasmid replication protein, II/X family [Pseudomonas aeruginosa]MCT7418582.1 phage/plasmid replication protein, II/X family [Pseudomonas aeruginosa]
MKIPSKVLGAYMLDGKQGVTFKLVAKATYYRHRQVLLGYGIDINIRCDRRDDSNVVPMIRILEAEPAAIRTSSLKGADL